MRVKLHILIIIVTINPTNEGMNSMIECYVEFLALV